MVLSLSRAAWVRIVPFAVFMMLLLLRSRWPLGSIVDSRWIYAANVFVVGGLLLWFGREYGELFRQNLPTAGEVALAVLVGIVIFVLWISLDAPWMRIGHPSAEFKALDAQGRLDWPLIAIRWVGGALIVPVMEELFWRSFLMRWVQSPQFETVDPRQVGLKAVGLSSFVFMLAHTLWLAAIITGLVYACLYVRIRRLWVPIIAHAVTNGALGVWVVKTGQWQFW
jgi:CAAX prenyl protease-like protein